MNEGLGKVLISMGRGRNVSQGEHSCGPDHKSDRFSIRNVKDHDQIVVNILNWGKANFNRVRIFWQTWTRYN